VRRLGLALVALVILAVLAAASVVWSAQRRLLFPLRRAGDASARLAAVGGEPVWLEAGGVRSEAWFLPARDRTSPGPLLIYTHGNGELIDDWVDGFETPRGWGMNVLLVEYPGYGRSGGAPSERSIRAAMLAAYDWASARPEVDPKRIVGYGRSLGGGAICALAGQRPLEALVLESTFTSVRALAKRLGVPGFLVLDPFDNLALVRGFDGPILVLHGTRDEVIPVEQGKALHAAAARSELELLGCGHNDCPRPWPRVRAFLAANALVPGS
jgi:fermentation-respiration switch protein FrsA (DUF1100 family)